MRMLLPILFLFGLSVSLVAAMESDTPTEIDHLAIATIMIHDGRFEKAEAELSKVDPSSEKIDAADYYTIRGVLDFKQDRNKNAIENYLKAIDATKKKTFLPPKNPEKQKYLFSIGKSKTEEEPEIAFVGKKIKKEKLEKLYLYLSQAYYKIQDYANTARHLDFAGDRGTDRPELFSLRAECYWKLEQFSDAINSINRGLKHFPDNANLLKQKYYYFAELELYQSAIETAYRYMTVTQADAKEYIILAQLLTESGQVDEAAKVLEKAKGIFPENAKITMLLGHIYMKKDMEHTAAYFFKAGAYHDKQYLKAAVEMHRRIKDYPHAIFLNTQMSDKVEKLKQKVAILLDRAEYEKVIGLKDDMDRYSLLDDDNMRYALAYSYYMAKDYPNAEKHLKMIQDDKLFIKGTTILKNIEKCRENSMECF